MPHPCRNTPFPYPNYIWWTLTCQLVLVLLHSTQLHLFPAWGKILSAFSCRRSSLQIFPQPIQNLARDKARTLWWSLQHFCWVRSECHPWWQAIPWCSDWFPRICWRICEFQSASAWSSGINILSDIAKSQPQAAFSALTHGLLNKWTYLNCVVPDISHLRVPLDDVLRTNLIPAITGRSQPNNLTFVRVDEYGGKDA